MSSSSSFGYVSQTVSVSLVNVTSGTDLRVEGLRAPISIALPVDSPLLSTSCTGQPSEAGVLAQMQAGSEPCSRAVECRYWCAPRRVPAPRLPALSRRMPHCAPIPPARASTGTT
jgi:hypothetical protein